MNNDMTIFEPGGQWRRLRFFYRNWRGEQGYRTVKGLPTLWFGTTPYHKDPQWFLKAYDVEKEDIRDFAVADIIEFVK